MLIRQPVCPDRHGPKTGRYGPGTGRYGSETGRYGPGTGRYASEAGPPGAATDRGAPDPVTGNPRGRDGSSGSGLQPVSFATNGQPARWNGLMN